MNMVGHDHKCVYRNMGIYAVNVANQLPHRLARRGQRNVGRAAEGGGPYGIRSHIRCFGRGLRCK